MKTPQALTNKYPNSGANNSDKKKNDGLPQQTKRKSSSADLRSAVVAKKPCRRAKRYLVSQCMMIENYLHSHIDEACEIISMKDCPCWEDLQYDLGLQLSYDARVTSKCVCVRLILAVTKVQSINAANVSWSASNLSASAEVVAQRMTMRKKQIEAARLNQTYEQIVFKRLNSSPPFVRSYCSSELNNDKAVIIQRLKRGKCAAPAAVECMCLCVCARV